MGDFDNLLRPGRIDKMEIKNVYMGMVILYEDKQEVIPVVQNTESLEYEITRAIRKLTNPVTPKVAFTEGHGELNLKENLTYVDKVVQMHKGSITCTTVQDYSADNGMHVDLVAFEIELPT